MSALYQCKGENCLASEITLNEAMPNIFNNMLFTNEGKDLICARTSLGAGAVLPAHKAKGTAFYVVTEGSGTVYMEDDNGNVLHELPFAAGDVLVSEEPHKNRRYVAGENGLSYTLVAKF